DKSTLHNYHLIYTAILSRLGKIEGLLEFGIGTNNTSIANNMGANGSPGASLRAFHEFLPNASIIGADIDKAILFNEEGIQCFYVDQTDMTSFEMLDNQIASPLTLIIDDGLHLPNANLATLIFSLEKMKSQENGWFVVEDIRGESLPIWHLIAHILSKTYKCYIIRTKTAYVFAVEIVNSN
ncbi:MAG: hypothetical protein KA767_03820, partial [Saprospiraceae bacterium]|nr:hypothetical protein [Saprospiraceae bacterium]